MISQAKSSAPQIQPRESDFLARLAATQAGLSPKMARLAAFFSAHYVQAAFMTTREIAAAAGVSLATVVRFPVALGYEDFEALRSSIQDRLNFDLSAVERMRSLSTNNQSPSALMRRIIDAELANLSALVHTFSETEVEAFVSAVLVARQITIVGCRYASALAVYFAYSLGKIKPNVSAFTQADSSLYDRVRLMDPDDTIIVISLARYPSDQLALAQYAHGQGRRILAITDSPLSPVLPYAEVTLFAKTNLLDFVGSLGAPAALINCLVSEVGVRLGDAAVERLQSLEDVAEQTEIYVRGGSRPGEFKLGSAPFERRLLAW